MRTQVLIVLLTLAPLMVPYPAGADESGDWTTTAPTDGGAWVGIEWQLNDGSGWVDVTDDPDPADLVYPYTQGTASSVQARCRAYNYRAEPVVANGILTGTTTVKQYGVWSDPSDPNTVNEPSPGGCGMPYFNIGR